MWYSTSLQCTTSQYLGKQSDAIYKCMELLKNKYKIDSSLSFLMYIYMLVRCRQFLELAIKKAGRPFRKGREEPNWYRLMTP